MKIQGRQIRFAQDEGSGGGTESKKVDLADLPDDAVVNLGGDIGEVTAKEARQWAKGNKQVTEGFQSLSEERKAWERQKEEWARQQQERESRLFGVMEGIPDSIGKALAPKEDAGPEPTEVLNSIDEEWEKLDLVTDEEAPKKLRDLRRREREATSASHKRELQALREEMEERISKTQRDVEGKVAHTQAVQLARQRNDRVFEETLEKEFGDKLELTPEMKQKIRRKFEQHIGDQDYGHYDKASRQWLHSEQAVIDSVWAVDDAREALISHRTASDTTLARRDGLQARIRGEAASSSTPGRTNRSSSPSNREDQFVRKIEAIREGLAKGELTETDVRAMLTPEERATYRKLQREFHHRRAAAEAA